MGMLSLHCVIVMELQRGDITVCQLHKEHTVKANPRRELAKDETTKLAKLEGIAEKLKRGENVHSD